MKRLATVIGLLVAVLAGCGDDGGTLTVYSGRSEDLVGPLISRYEEQTGVGVTVRYAGSTELAATLLEEGDRTPADVFFAQDPASLGAVAAAGMFTPLPPDLLGEVPGRFSDGAGRWVGVSGRVRVVVYNTDAIDAGSLPDTVAGFTTPEWKGRLGIAPTNSSFLAFVAGMIESEGEAETRGWLAGIAANDPITYANNSSIVDAVARGEVDAGLVNHYYLLRAADEQGGVDAANHFLAAGDPGALVMPAGAGVLAAGDEDAALDFVRFLLSQPAQEYFALETFEFPLAEGVTSPTGLPPLGSLSGPDIDLSSLAGALDRATVLVTDAGLL